MHSTSSVLHAFICAFAAMKTRRFREGSMKILIHMSGIKWHNSSRVFQQTSHKMNYAIFPIHNVNNRCPTADVDYIFDTKVL